MEEHEKDFDICVLALTCLDGTISPEQMAELNSRLMEDPVQARQYVEMILISAGLAGRFGGRIQAVESTGASQGFMSLMQKLADAEALAETIPVEKPADEPPPASTPTKDPVPLSQRITKFQIGVLFATAAMLAVIVYLHFAPVAPLVVATLTRSFNAEWEGRSEPFVDLAALNPGVLKLERGYAELKLVHGASVILQAPASIELLEINSLHLMSGNITCKVPPEAIGFSIQTENGSIVDYGTEFGVTVSACGELKTHVFEGNVALRSGRDPLVFSQERRIKEGEAGIVDSKGSIAVSKIAPNLSFYARKVPGLAHFGQPGVRIDLADILGGGNGFGTGKADCMVDVRSGNLEYRRNDAVPFEGGNLIGIADSVPFVDCLFIPDGGEGPTQISSTGDRTSEFPDTCGQSYGYAANGGVVRHITGAVDTIVLDGVRYGSSVRPAIYMHSNLGVTFNLDAMRNMMPGLNIKRFTAKCGISASILNEVNERTINPEVRFWVFVDGQVRFSSVNMRVSSKPEDICVPLKPEDQLLTLAVTDGDGRIEYDWGVFALPALEIAR